jgi:hypothetical protein
MLMKNWYIYVVDVHELSMLLLREIFHQLHRHAINFVLIKLQEFFVVYNVSDVVVVELLEQNLNQEYPIFIKNKIKLSL